MGRLVPARVPTILAALAALAAPLRAQTDYVEDFRWAVEALEKECGALLDAKKIDWRKATQPLLEDAKAVRDNNDYAILLQRLLARLQDGHCEVRKLPAAGDIVWPADPRGERTGVGMFWCRIGGKLFVKNAWNEAEKAGVQPGMEVLEVNGVPAAKWLDQRLEELRDRLSFSSPQHAFSYACHMGLADFPGTKIALVLKKPKGKKTEREITFVRSNPTPWGPAFFPKNMKSVTAEGDVNYAFIDKKWGYIHLRRSPGDLPEQVDTALVALEDAKGLILDYRGNSGGGFDHDAFMGRFVPAGKSFSSGKDYASTGAHPFGGPIVAIVDATCRSAGETGAGLFKDDGRGYVIGESPTAGMSSQKTTIELPSKLFELFVSTGSNKGRYNAGRGLEGIGVIPHRIVEFDPADLEEKVDTLTRVAQELLEKFPQKDVRYDPKDFGWKR